MKALTRYNPLDPGVSRLQQCEKYLVSDILSKQHRLGAIWLEKVRQAISCCVRMKSFAAMTLEGLQWLAYGQTEFLNR